MAKSNQKVDPEVASKLLSILETDHPGIFRTAVGGTEKEIDGERVLTGYELVGVPIDENGFPEAREVLYRGWESAKGKTFVIEKNKNARAAGTWRVPIVVNGKLKELQGILMAMRGRDGSPAKWTFNTGIRNTYQKMLKDEDGEVTGETEEATSYVPPIRVPGGYDQELEIVVQRRAYDALGQMIALSNDINFELA